MKIKLLILLAILFSGCAQIRKTYPMLGAGGGAAVGALGGPGTAAAGGMIGYAAGKEMADVDYHLGTYTPISPIVDPRIEQLLTEGDVKGIASEIIKAQLAESEASWGDKAVREVKGLVNLCLWVGGIGFVVFVVIIPFLHRHGIHSIKNKLHKELEEQWAKIKK